MPGRHTPVAASAASQTACLSLLAKARGPASRIWMPPRVRNAFSKRSRQRSPGAQGLPPWRDLAGVGQRYRTRAACSGVPNGCFAKHWPSVTRQAGRGAGHGTNARPCGDPGGRNPGISGRNDRARPDENGQEHRQAAGDGWSMAARPDLGHRLLTLPARTPPTIRCARRSGPGRLRSRP